ncbi:MAG: hypothetical protein ACP5NP_08155 [Acetobacteraceae bacterium]
MPPAPTAAAAAEAMLARLYQLATASPDETIRMSAAEALLDRLQGKPVAEAQIRNRGI